MYFYKIQDCHLRIFSPLKTFKKINFKYFKMNYLLFGYYYLLKYLIHLFFYYVNFIIIIRVIKFLNLFC